MEFVLLQSSDAAQQPYLDLVHDVHQAYAERCGARYLVFRGRKEPDVHAAWNRVPMMLDAFAAGARKCVWLDTDALVVNQDVNIFTETDDDVPLQMSRVPGSTVEYPWGEEPDSTWNIWNDGVLVANRSAIPALEGVWAQRRAPLRPWHKPKLWELNWLLDWAFDHRDDVAELSGRFNFMPSEGDVSAWDPTVHIDDAVIRAWHGYLPGLRGSLFRQAYLETYGSPSRP